MVYNLFHFHPGHCQSPWSNTRLFCLILDLNGLIDWTYSGQKPADTNIVALLVWKFSIPVLIANVISWPLAWFLMSGWLDTFSYPIADSRILVASFIAGGSAFVIAWLTVASRAIRVARANPIRALRYE